MCISLSLSLSCSVCICVWRWSGSQEQCHPVAMRQLVPPEGARESEREKQREGERDVWQGQLYTFVASRYDFHWMPT